MLVPGEAASSKALPVSAVTVWSVPSLLSTVMVAPGLTETSLLPMAIESTGADLGTVYAALIERAVARA